MFINVLQNSGALVIFEAFLETFCIHIICPCLKSFGAVDFACLELKYMEIYFLTVLFVCTGEMEKHIFSLCVCVNKCFS